jgi:hypothetical protein
LPRAQRKFTVPLRITPSWYSASSIVGSGASSTEFVRVLRGSRSKFRRWEPGARLPELSNFCCLPGRAGGSPWLVRLIGMETTGDIADGNRSITGYVVFVGENGDKCLVSYASVVPSGKITATTVGHIIGGTGNREECKASFDKSSTSIRRRGARQGMPSTKSSTRSASELTQSRVVAPPGLTTVVLPCLVAGKRPGTVWLV